MIRLTAFLGNPGAEYACHRHNAGRLLAERLPFYPSLDWRKKYRGRYAFLDGREVRSASAEGEPAGLPEKYHFLMPETYMNLSGEPVFQAASFFKIPIGEILVVHDELELPLGTLSLKFSGGLGGHNGLRSMKACFGSADFWRLRIGIGRPDRRLPGEGGPPGSGKGVADWVLSNFAPCETEQLDPVLQAGAALLVQALIKGTGALLPEWGKKKLTPAAGVSSAQEE